MPLKGLGNVKAAINRIPEQLNNDVKGVFIAGLTNIIQETPVDTGVTRNAWFLSVGAPSGANGGRANKSGSGSVKQLAKMPKSILGKTLYFTNNRPNINTLEYGGFPTPVKQGSHIKRSKSYEKLSSGGYSKQAPGGWVRKSLILMRNKIRKL